MGMDKAREAAMAKSEEAVISAMKNAYFAAKQNLATTIIPALNELVIHQGGHQLSNLKVDDHTNYQHNSSVSEMQEAMCSVLEDSLRDKVLGSTKFSLMLDESTDISVHQNMIAYIRFLESNAHGYMEPHTRFLGVAQLEKANADSIFNAVVTMLNDKGIDISGLCGVCTDGAAVMVGCKSGVVKKLRSETTGLLATHCIAHRVALSCCSGADVIPYLVKVQEILNSVYKYFHYSPKNMAMLERVQSLLPGQSSRFKQVFHTRWLSFEGSVSAMVTNYGSLLSVFMEEKSGKCLSLHKSISCYKFLYVVNFLCDVLKPLVILSKMFQKSDLDFSQVNPLLSSTISCLEELRDKKNGQNLVKFLSAVPTETQVTFEFEGHDIRDSDKQRDEAVKVCDRFVSEMIKSLNDRFSENQDSLILSALSNFFNPGLDLSVKDGDADTVSDYLGDVGFSGFREELRTFSHFADSQKSMTSTMDVVNLAIKYQEVYPATAEAAKRLMVAPVSTADCERGFSRQNLVKTSLRNSLNVRSLERLLMISIDGPALQEFDFKLSFKKWAGQKTRRILQ